MVAISVSPHSRHIHVDGEPILYGVIPEAGKLRTDVVEVCYST